MIRNGSFPLAAQQPSKESFRAALVTVRLNQNVDHVAVLIHGTPEILLLPVDSNEDFVQVPDIAEAALTPLQFSGIVRTELLTPESNRFIRNCNSAFGQKILDVSEAQAESMVNPDGIADDFWRETVTVIGRPIIIHQISVSTRRPTSQCLNIAWKRRPHDAELNFCGAQGLRCTATQFQRTKTMSTFVAIAFGRMVATARFASRRHAEPVKSAWVSDFAERGGSALS
jgi:hypothetical protein